MLGAFFLSWTNLFMDIVNSHQLYHFSCVIFFFSDNQQLQALVASYSQNNWSVCSVQFSASVMSNYLRPHEPQYARPPCPSPTPRVHPNPCPLSWWYHPPISSSVVPFSSHPQSFPESGFLFFCVFFFSNESALHIRWPKYWSFSFNISPSSEHQDWSPLGWTGWISVQSKGLSRVFSNTTVQKHQFFGVQLSL